MEQILIYGAGGAAKDIIRLVEQTKKFRIIGVIVDGYYNATNLLGYKILGNYTVVEQFGAIGVVIANGTPQNKKEMLSNISKYDHVSYPNIVHPTVNIHHSNTLSKGIILEEGVVITSNITLEDFVSVNVNASISHDCKIGKFVTISPKASLAGNVHIYDDCFIGINSTIIEKRVVGKSSVIAAGAVVIRDVPSNVMVGGVPAKVIKEI